MYISKTLATTALLAAVAYCSNSAANDTPDFLDVNYQSYTAGQNYTESDFKSDMKDIIHYRRIGDSDYSIRKYPNDTNLRRLRAFFNEGEFGADNLQACATKLVGKKNYTMHYSVRFAHNWEFVKGGKLPGLSAGSNPAGGDPDTNGMSARIMWRSDSAWDGAYGGDSKNYLELYHYWRGQARAYNNGNGDPKRKHGDRSYLVDAKKNNWYDIKIKITLGSDSKNGRLEQWVNGIKKHDRRYRYFDNGDNWNIDRVMFVFFHGGGDNSWAATQDMHLLFDNLKVEN